MQRQDGPAPEGNGEPGGKRNVASHQAYHSRADFATVAAAALSSADRVLAYWLPGGKRQGADGVEYLAQNPTRADNKPGSFSINTATGKWADFATGDKGGDLVALVAYIGGYDQGEAARRLADFLGIEGQGKKVNGAQHSQAKRQGDEWKAITPVPRTAPEPPAVHPKFGHPSRTWTYRDADSETLFHVYRFETAGGKETRPLSFCREQDKRTAWRWKALPVPRPLYNLDRLAARPNAPVIICEGEKSADAAGELFPDCAATTPPNGAQSPNKADWTPLKGRRCWIWPDHDEAGRKFADAVAKLAQQAGAQEVRELRVADGLDRLPGSDPQGKPTLNPRPEGEPLPAKWDAADALADGWTPEHTALLRNDHALLIEPTALSTEDAKTPLEDRFRINDSGVWYRPPTDKNGNQPPDVWVCAPLHITAATRDDARDNHGHLLEFKDRHGHPHHWAMPLELLEDRREYRRALRRMGLKVSSSKEGYECLQMYLDVCQAEIKALCVSRNGWHGGAFVFPDRTIGQPEERILFQTDAPGQSAFRCRGTLDEWRAHVAALCTGNSRLVFAVSAAFAALLLEAAGDESGGFHLRGDSSSGKTTILNVASAVYGGPDYVQRWRATDNGLEAVASQHTDTLLILDELAQVDPRVAGEVAYMLANGEGKARANRNGGARHRASWRLLFLSAGEIGLADHMRQAGKKARAGQETRLADIPADAGAGLGVFGDLHGYANGAAFSRALTEAAARYFGTAAPAFLEAIIPQRDTLPGIIAELRKDFLTNVLPEDASGQAYRVAGRFALVAISGELATDAGITGWTPGEALRAAQVCFRAWLEARGGAGNQEAAAMLAQVRQFFETHGEARFVRLDGDAKDRTTINRAGFRREGVKGTEYFVLPETFKNEVCQGFDSKAVARLLVERGILAPDADGKNSKRERLPGMGRVRSYVFTPKLWEVER